MIGLLFNVDSISVKMVANSSNKCGLYNSLLKTMLNTLNKSLPIVPPPPRGLLNYKSSLNLLVS